jgi:dephospho-CoA kinase
MSEADDKPHKKSRIILCLTGMPGAGKSVVAEVGQSQGFEVYRMGDDVRLEAQRRNLQPNDENLGSIMIELRQKNGATAIAQLTRQRIETDSNSAFITIDGIRSTPEFQEFKKLGKAKLVTVHASPDKRFEFVKTRGREDSPSSIESFGQRDDRELSVGVGEVMAISEEVIPNSGTLDDLKKRAEELFASAKKQANSD